MLKESDRMKYMQPGVFAGLAHERVLLEAAGVRVIDLSVGSPDMAPSLDIREAVSQSAMLAWNYSYSLEDMPQMRDAVKSWYLARYGVNTDTDSEIISLNGSMDALVHMYLAFTNPGDKVLIGDPYYPAQLTGARIAGCEPVFMPLRMENDFLPDLSAIPDEVADAAKLILVSYPNNPTTAIAPDSFWNELIEFAARHGILVVHDNAYSDITYDGITARSFLEFDGAKDVGIELNSLSKTYSVPGMRAAFMVGNAAAVSAFSKLKTNIDLGMPYTVQYAVIAALTQEQSCVEDIRSIYEERRNVMTTALTEIGLPPVPCKGTPYLWMKLPELMPDDRAFCMDLLHRAHVALTPGSAFGNEGRGYVRAALMRKSTVLQEAAESIAASGLITA